MSSAGVMDRPEPMLVRDGNELLPLKLVRIDTFTKFQLLFIFEGKKKKNHRMGNLSIEK